MNTIFIGIAGGTGSGKTTLTEHLAARFGSDISVVTTTTTTSGRTDPSPSAACKTTTIPTPSTPT